jgi:ubiquinone/menaquinone biosynthesis C-methylase UbiE
MERILEAELMDDQQQALAYAEADFSASNQAYVDLVLAGAPAGLGRVLDIGCGPADVDVLLAASSPASQITAVDGSAAMIELARRAVAAAGLDGRIRLVQAYVPGLSLEERSFDTILSKDFLHHLPDPAALWGEARRLGRPGAAVVVMDLVRPESPQAAQAIVEAVAADEHPLLKEDFYNSLCAAFTLAEVAEQLGQAGLDLAVRQVSERHMLISGRL